MSLPRYPSYKPSGVEWLGDVPEHWAVAALGYRYRVALGKMLDAKQISGAHLRPYLRNTDVQWGRINTADLPEMDFDNADRVRFGLRTGDILVCEGGEVGRAAVWEGQLSDCYYQKALHRLRPTSPQSEDPRFMFWLLRAAVASGCFAADESKATIAHLPAEAFRRVRFPFAAKKEQQAVAAFLDRETAKIDALVAEQERLIELLKEKRQAVISHAVTKGLNPNAPMKDSGIEWVGSCPNHWRVAPLGRLATSRCDGPFGSGLKSEHYAVDGVRVIRLQNIRSGAFDGTDSAFVGVDYYQAELLGHDVGTGDVLVAGLGDDNHAVGRACVAPPGIEPAMVKADCFRFRLDTTLLRADYAAIALSAGAVADGGRLANGSTRSRIPLSDMASRRLAVPPLDEQEAVVSYVGRQTSNFDALQGGAQRAIDLLLERRTALISAAVTGQIDVRPESMRTAA